MTTPTRSDYQTWSRNQRSRAQALTAIGIVLIVLGVAANIVVMLTSGITFGELMTLNGFGLFMKSWEVYSFFVFLSPALFFSGVALFFKNNGR